MTAVVVEPDVDEVVDASEVCSIPECGGEVGHEVLLACPACGDDVRRLCCVCTYILRRLFAGGLIPPCGATGQPMRLVAVLDLRPH